MDNQYYDNIKFSEKYVDFIYKQCLILIIKHCYINIKVSQLNLNILCSYKIYKETK